MSMDKRNKNPNNVKANQRKRVNQIKSFIIFIVVVLLFSSVFLNLALIFKVLKLERQVQQIYSNNNYEIQSDLIAV